MERLTSGTPRPAVRAPTAQVAPKVLARGVHALLVLLMRVEQYQVLLSWSCIPVGALGAHSGKRGTLRQREVRSVVA